MLLCKILEHFNKYHSLEEAIHLKFINKSKIKRYKKIIKHSTSKIIISIKLKVHLLIRFNVVKQQEVLKELQNFQVD